MTKDSCKQYAYGTFEQFLAEFNKREWERHKKEIPLWEDVKKENISNE